MFIRKVLLITLSLLILIEGIYLAVLVVKLKQLQTMRSQMVKK